MSNNELIYNSICVVCGTLGFCVFYIALFTEFFNKKK